MITTGHITNWKEEVVMFPFINLWNCLHPEEELQVQCKKETYISVICHPIVYIIVLLVVRIKSRFIFKLKVTFFGRNLVSSALYLITELFMVPI